MLEKQRTMPAFQTRAALPYMAIYFVSRHSGARDWALHQGLQATWLEHLDADLVQPGDVVMGTLPVHLAAEVCARQAHYWHLELSLPRQARGRELQVDELQRLSARLVRYRVVREGCG